MPEQATTDDTAQVARQHATPASPTTTRDWTHLLVLRPDNQPFAAVALLCCALAFGGWYVWRTTTSPGLVDLDRTEPANSKLVVNVNTAEAAELMLLPEVGPKIANLIVKEREANGAFPNAKSFGLRIKGIGPKTLPKIVPFLEGWTDETATN
jgi:competence protein ComEA